MNRTNWKVCVMLAVSGTVHVLLVTSIAQATLTALEAFNYPNVGGGLNGQSGGGSFGFSDSWLADPSVTVNVGSLVSPVMPTSTSGNSVTSVAFGANRYTSRTLSSTIGTANSTRYVSWLMRPEGILHQGAHNGWFTFSMQGDRVVHVGMGSFTDTYGLEVRGTSTFTSLDAAVGQTVLFVLRMDFTAGVDTFRLYVNPQPGMPEPEIADASQINIDIGLHCCPANAGMFFANLNDFNELR